MEEIRTSVLSELVDRLSPIRGVVAVLLFGSVARGDYDEYSDYDVLIVLKDRESLNREWDALFSRIGDMKLDIHAIPETMEELRNANPVFLDELRKHGKVLFARTPFRVSLGATGLEPLSIVTYDLSMLPYKDKMRAIYAMYGKGGKGLVGESGGSRLGHGCVVVPREAGTKLVGLLRSIGAGAVGIDILAEGPDRGPFGLEPRKAVAEGRGRTQERAGKGSSTATPPSPTGRRARRRLWTAP